MRGGGWVEWGSKRELGYKWGSRGSVDCVFFYFGSLDYSMFFQIRNGTLVCNVKGYLNNCNVGYIVGFMYL